MIKVLECYGGPMDGEIREEYFPDGYHWHMMGGLYKGDEMVDIYHYKMAKDKNGKEYLVYVQYE